MKDVNSINQAIKGQKFYYKIAKVDACINTGLAQLWNNENVINAFVCNIDDSVTNILFITDKNRIILCCESKTEIKGMLFDRTSYAHSAYAFDMTNVDGNKSRCVARKVGGTFGNTYYDVIFEGQEKSPLTFTLNDNKQATAFLNDVLNNATKCSKSAVTQKFSPTTSESSTMSPSASTNSENSAIAEIRKMYEDGIIDKAEMIDLIKSINK